MRLLIVVNGFLHGIFSIKGAYKDAFKKKEREILQQLEAQEDNTAEIHETFSNLKQEVEIKTRKLKKLYSKLQQASCFFAQPQKFAGVLK